MTPMGCGQFGPKELDWQDLCRGPLNIATYLLALSLVVSEKKTFEDSLTT